MTAIRSFFFISLILTGFFSGIGFVNAVGLMPAAEDTAVQHWVPYWQALDGYMRLRMPMLGLPMLLSILVTIVLLARQKPFDRAALLTAAAALVMVLADLFIAFSMNLPINEALQQLDPENVPADFRPLQMRAVQAFYLRSVFMIFSAVFITLSYFRYEASKDRLAKRNVYF